MMRSMTLAVIAVVAPRIQRKAVISIPKILVMPAKDVDGIAVLGVVVANTGADLAEPTKGAKPISRVSCL